MIASFGLALLQAGSLSGCTPGAKIEGRLGGEWLPATVIEARRDECVVKMMYVGVEQIVHLAPKDFRAEVSAPAVAQRAAARDLRSSPQSAGIVSATPEQIYNDFDRDGAAAAAKYVDHQLRITGPAHAIADGQMTFFRLGYDLVATCHFPVSARPQLARVQKGQKVTVSGYVESRVSHHALKMTSCVLENVGGVPQAASISKQPPAGRYLCHSGGEQNGFMDLTPSSYIVDGVRGGYRYNPRTKQFTWLGGSYAKWGWTGTWEAGSPRADGVADPRITLRGTAPRITVSCFPPK